MDKPEIATPFDLVGIDIDGQTVMARPIAWDSEFVDGEGHTADGSMASPVAFETVCPFCSQLIQFDGMHVSIECPECGRGDSIEAADPYPFCDPIDYKVCDVDADISDVMEIIEEAEASDV
jgi:endogenous inhibitor of DNA gyrase (YacG/DUF329 family)